MGDEAQEDESGGEMNDAARQSEFRINVMAAKMADLDAVGSVTSTVDIDGDVVLIPTVWIVLAECCGRGMDWVLDVIKQGQETAGAK